MGWSKAFFFLFVNLSVLELVQGSADEDPQPTVSTESTLNSYPFDQIFGQNDENAVKNNQRLQQENHLYNNIIEYFDINKARGVYWIPTTCDSFLERGYTCVGCGESLHCMGGNFALKAICGGRRPFCYNGVCSDLRGEKCRRDATTSPQIQNDVPAEGTLNSTLT